MQIGALIVAAGMSTRMGEFKPMLSIGSISVAQRVIATLSQSGVSKIVMVTGYNATMLERHLSGTQRSHTAELPSSTALSSRAEEGIYRISKKR